MYDSVQPTAENVQRVSNRFSRCAIPNRHVEGKALPPADAQRKAIRKGITVFAEKIIRGTILESNDLAVCIGVTSAVLQDHVDADLLQFLASFSTYSPGTPQAKAYGRLVRLIGDTASVTTIVPPPHLSDLEAAILPGQDEQSVRRQLRVIGGLCIPGLEAYVDAVHGPLETLLTMLRHLCKRCRDVLEVFGPAGLGPHPEPVDPSDPTKVLREGEREGGRECLSSCLSRETHSS